jgi:hypothetical protein
MLLLYAATHREMDCLLDITEDDPTEGSEEFHEQNRYKRNPSGRQAKRSKKTVTTATGPTDSRIQSQGEIPPRNFFALLRATEMEFEHSIVEESTHKPDGAPQQASSKSGRLPPIMLTSTTNLMQLQRQIKDFVTGSSETPGAGPELSRKKWWIFQP